MAKYYSITMPVTFIVADLDNRSIREVEDHVSSDLQDTLCLFTLDTKSWSTDGMLEVREVDQPSGNVTLLGIN